MMFHCEYGLFTNYWGTDEAYVRKSIESYMSGHVHNKDSTCYSNDACGNCDGGRCDSCQEIYVVTAYGPPKYNGMYEETVPMFYKRFVNIESAWAQYNWL